jgi:hypothetical protein
MVYGHSEIEDYIPRIDDRLAAIPKGGLLLQVLYSWHSFRYQTVVFDICVYYSLFNLC